MNVFLKAWKIACTVLLRIKNTTILGCLVSILPTLFKNSIKYQILQNPNSNDILFLKNILGFLVVALAKNSKIVRQGMDDRTKIIKSLKICTGYPSFVDMYAFYTSKTCNLQYRVP